MISLSGGGEEEALKGRVPEVALRQAKELRGSGVTVLVLEREDDVRRDFQMVGRYGLLTYLDDHYQAPFEYVRHVVEGERRVFLALLAPSGRYLLVVPEEDWVDDRLLVVLDVEGEELLDSGQEEAKWPPKMTPNRCSGPDGDRTAPGATNNVLLGDGRRQ